MMSQGHHLLTIVVSSSLSSEGSYISSDISGDEVNSTNPSFIDMAASLFISQTST